MGRAEEDRGVEHEEKVTVLRTDEVAEERDLVGVYLHEISRTPLLDAAQEVELSRAIEAGLYAQHLLAEGPIRDRGRPSGLKLLGRGGGRGQELLIRAQPRPGGLVSPRVL